MIQFQHVFFITVNVGVERTIHCYKKGSATKSSYLSNMLNNYFFFILTRSFTMFAFSVHVIIQRSSIKQLHPSLTSFWLYFKFYVTITKLNTTLHIFCVDFIANFDSIIFCVAFPIFYGGRENTFYFLLRFLLLNTSSVLDTPFYVLLLFGVVVVNFSYMHFCSYLSTGY